MIYLCLGRREQGKTTLALYLTRSAPARVVFDPRGLVPVPPGGQRVITQGQIQSAFDELWTATESRTAQLVVTPEGRVQPMFERVCIEVKRWIREPGAPPIAFVVDEFRFIDSDTEAFDWLCRCATRAQVTIVGTAHRPTDVPTDVRAIADVWCLFQTTQEHDLDLIETRCSRATKNAVQRLKPREFIVWDDTRGVMDFHGNPQAWYVPLGAPGASTTTENMLPAPTKLDNGRLFQE